MNSKELQEKAAALLALLQREPINPRLAVPMQELAAALAATAPKPKLSLCPICSEPSAITHYCRAKEVTGKK